MVKPRKSRNGRKLKKNGASWKQDASVAASPSKGASAASPAKSRSDYCAPSTTTSNGKHQHQPYPLPFPPGFQWPKDDFLRNEGPYKDSFKAALETSYEGFVVENSDQLLASRDDDASMSIKENVVQSALSSMVDEGYFRYDVTQPFGLGTKCAKTYVTRCVVGEHGTTYKYLGLRMFAIPWSSASPDGHPKTDETITPRQQIHRLCTSLSQRTQQHLEALTATRRRRNAAPTRGRSIYDICLINRMEYSDDLKEEPTTSGKYKTTVSWHADSSLEHFSSIAVYQTIVGAVSQTHPTNKRKRRNKHSSNGNNEYNKYNGNKRNNNSSPKGKTKETSQPDSSSSWSVALRVSHDAEGPGAWRRGMDIDSTIDPTIPPIAASLPTGAAYYLLDDFNHHHQHTVLASQSPTQGSARYSCTFRLLRESHNVHFVLQRCRNTCSNFHKKGIKLWRSEQLLLTEMESEWLRQFYIQGQQHYDLMMKHNTWWTQPIHELLRYWCRLETRTRQVVDLLLAAARGRCNTNTVTTPNALPRKERKAEERRKKAAATILELMHRAAASDADHPDAHLFYEPMAELLEERAKMRGLWNKREHDHVFHLMDKSCRPLPLPVEFQSTAAAGAQYSSPMPGTAKELRELAADLRKSGRAFASCDAKDLPELKDVVVVTNGDSSIGDHSNAKNKGDTNIALDHTKNSGDKNENSDSNSRVEQVKLNWHGWQAAKPESPSRKFFALEMQSPWASAVLDGSKIIETRLYPLPPSLMGVRIAILESPLGDAGISQLGNVLQCSDICIAGWCVFESTVEYAQRSQFEADAALHLVKPESGYGWKDGVTKKVYGWKVDSVQRCSNLQDIVPPSSWRAANYTHAIRRMRSLFEFVSEEQAAAVSAASAASSLSDPHVVSSNSLDNGQRDGLGGRPKRKKKAKKQKMNAKDGTKVKKRRY